ncbi:MAG TPA: chromate transporter [Albitalea sp.]|nr:chromate transporter [Albitalea sp.]
MSDPVDEGASPAVPRSPADLFWSFTWMALQGFGGVLPVAQRTLVERKRWMTREQFIETLAVSQVLPGPNVVNMSLMIGDRHFGLRGACAALGGMLLVPLLLVLALTALYGHFAAHPAVSGALRGMGAVAAGLVLSTALKLASTLRRNAMGLAASVAFAAITFVTIALLRWPLVWVLLGLGPVAVWVAWRRLGA